MWCTSWYFIPIIRLLSLRYIVYVKESYRHLQTQGQAVNHAETVGNGRNAASLGMELVGRQSNIPYGVSFGNVPNLF